jgi:predicted DNA-binding transcriptional regulator AlpA
MSGPTLTLAEVAQELGRSPDWLYENWRRLLRTERLPRPLQMQHPYIWSRAQIYAWIDRDLPAEQRIAAAAYRAAETAALAATGRPSGAEAHEVAAHHQRLNTRFVRDRA